MIKIKHILVILLIVSIAVGCQKENNSEYTTPDLIKIYRTGWVDSTFLFDYLNFAIFDIKNNLQGGQLLIGAVGTAPETKFDASFGLYFLQLDKSGQKTWEQMYFTSISFVGCVIQNNATDALVFCNDWDNKSYVLEITNQEIKKTELNLDAIIADDKKILDAVYNKLTNSYMVAMITDKTVDQTHEFKVILAEYDSKFNFIRIVHEEGFLPVFFDIQILTITEICKKLDAYVHLFLYGNDHYIYCPSFGKMKLSKINGEIIFEDNMYWATNINTVSNKINITYNKHDIVYDRSFVLTADESISEMDTILKFNRNTKYGIYSVFVPEKNIQIFCYKNFKNEIVLKTNDTQKTLYETSGFSIAGITLSEDNQSVVLGGTSLVSWGNTIKNMPYIVRIPISEILNNN